MGRQVVDEEVVELEQVGVQFEDVAQARVSRPDVVDGDRDAGRAPLVERRGELRGTSAPGRAR
jgi:hypothetical protein